MATLKNSLSVGSIKVNWVGDEGETTGNVQFLTGRNQEVTLTAEEINQLYLISRHVLQTKNLPKDLKQ